MWPLFLACELRRGSGRRAKTLFVNLNCSRAIVQAADPAPNVCGVRWYHGAMSEEATITDGRRLRSERSRKAIIRAAMDLIEEGHLVPTAQRVAERAGIGIRSFFRHFPDMESFFAAVDAEIRQSYEALFIGGNREGSLQERILHAVERRSEGYEIETNIILSTHAQSWRYGILRRNYARSQRGLRKDLDDWLPELAELDAQTREAVDAIASFEMWHRLRAHQGLGKKAAIELIVGLLEKLVAQS